MSCHASNVVTSVPKKDNHSIQIRELATIYNLAVGEDSTFVNKLDSHTGNWNVEADIYNDFDHIQLNRTYLAGMKLTI